MSDRQARRQQASSSGAVQEQELLRRYHLQGDLGARGQLAELMLPLARGLAGRYAGRAESMDDLVQVACVGVMKAIDGFDLSRQVRFSSYAVPTVLGEIRRHFRDRTWSVRVPRRLQELQMLVAKAREELTNDLGRSPTVSELADALDACDEDVLAAIEANSARYARSLSEPVGEDVTLGDSLGTSDAELRRAELRVLLDDAMAIISPREREILRLRFKEDLTQAEIAERTGVSQMQISRLIRQSVDRLRIAIEHEPQAVGVSQLVQRPAPSARNARRQSARRRGDAWSPTCNTGEQLRVSAAPR